MRPPAPGARPRGAGGGCRARPAGVAPGDRSAPPPPDSGRGACEQPANKSSPPPRGKPTTAAAPHPHPGPSGGSCGDLRPPRPLPAPPGGRPPGASFTVPAALHPPPSQRPPGSTLRPPGVMHVLRDPSVTRSFSTPNVSSLQPVRVSDTRRVVRAVANTCPTENRPRLRREPQHRVWCCPRPGAAPRPCPRPSRKPPHALPTAGPADLDCARRAGRAPGDLLTPRTPACFPLDSLRTRASPPPALPCLATTLGRWPPD